MDPKKPKMYFHFIPGHLSGLTLSGLKPNSGDSVKSPKKRANRKFCFVSERRPTYTSRFRSISAEPRVHLQLTNPGPCWSQESWCRSNFYVPKADLDMICVIAQKEFSWCSLGELQQSESRSRHRSQTQSTLEKYFLVKLRSCEAFSSGDQLDFYSHRAGKVGAQSLLTRDFIILSEWEVRKSTTCVLENRRNRVKLAAKKVKLTAKTKMGHKRDNSNPPSFKPSRSPNTQSAPVRTCMQQSKAK